jgi:hypothetical protein
MNKIIIIVDSGHFKAFKVTKAQMESARITLIEGYDSIDAHGKLGEKFSDRAGRFNRGDGQRKEAKGSGEPHNMKIELEKRLTKLIANDINSLITREDFPKWNLSAPGKINGQIIENLAPDVKNKLGESITADLTKTAKSKILSYFK